MKHVYAPVRVSFEWVSAKLVRVLFKNWHNFSSLSGLAWSWRVEVDGNVCARSDSALALQRKEVSHAEVLPGETLKVDLALGEIAAWCHAPPGSEAILHVSVFVPTGTCWSEAGHEVTFGQTYLPDQCGKEVRAKVSGPVILGSAAEKQVGMSVSSLGVHIVIDGPGGMCVRVDRERGGLVGLRYDGAELLSQGADGAGLLLHNFWRAHTDNDNGGLDMFESYQANEQRWRAESGWAEGRLRLDAPIRFILAWVKFWGNTSYASMWTRAGLDRLEPRGVRVQIISCEREEAVVRVDYTLSARGVMTKIPCTTTYRVCANGDVLTTNECVVSPFLPPLPRIGMQLAVSPSLECMLWYGRGPFETYTDRQTGAPIGRYSCSVEDTFVPYIRPSENGNRCGVRFASLTDRQGRGLLFAPAGPGEHMHFSAHNFTAHDVHKAKHPHEIRRRRDITVTVSH